MPDLERRCMAHPLLRLHVFGTCEDSTEVERGSTGFESDAKYIREGYQR